MQDRTRIKWAAAVIVLLIAAAGGILWYALAGEGQTAVATVNGTDITEHQYRDHLERVHGRQALEALIMREVIADAAERAGVTPTREEIDAEIADMKDEMGEAGFQQLLAQYGMTEESLRDSISISNSLDAVRFAEVQYDDGQLEDFFEENPDYFARPEQVRASHILVEDETAAQNILHRLAEGEDFSHLAETHSQDPGSADGGGDLGFFPRGVMLSAFEETAFSLDVGEVSEAVRTEAGYHIIKVTGRQKAREAVYEDVRDEVQQLYLDMHAPDREVILRRLQSEAQIEIHREELRPGF